MFFFFFNDTATTEIYTLSLHDALPICDTGASGQAAASGQRGPAAHGGGFRYRCGGCERETARNAARSVVGDRKSTRLNSSHSQKSYGVFCLKKKKQQHARLREPLARRP